MKNPFCWPDETRRIVAKIHDIAPRGIFSTGIENADPWVYGVRRNQLKECFDFYVHWQERLENIRSLGITWLRFGEGYSQVHCGPNAYNFRLTDKVVAKCEELGITLIADLMHFGLPAWLHADVPEYPFFQNPAFPEKFAEYAAVYTRRYPYVRHFDLVNETYPIAEWSAMIGIMNEHRSDTVSHVRAMGNVARAVILAREAIQRVWKEERREDEPLFLQSESMGKQFAIPHTNAEAETEHFNRLLRFVPLDLILGNRDADARAFLLKHGMEEAEYEWFMERGADRTGFILGIDHYPGCVTFRDGDSVEYGDHKQPYRFVEIVKEYAERYKTPLFHMEFNGLPEFGDRLLRATFQGVQELQAAGYPIIPGLTWYGDNYLRGWDTFLSGDNIINVGLFYEAVRQPIADTFVELSRKGFEQR